jgi:hypothetical protein
MCAGAQSDAGKREGLSTNERAELLRFASRLTGSMVRPGGPLSTTPELTRIDVA